MQFRTLKPQEIDCRIGGIYAGGFTLLLYKDARVDMDILDETVGPENWTREHQRDQAGRLWCKVAINPKEGVPFDPDNWPFKEDTGVESNAEKEKGEASDAFKRACVNWGIGRELYSAPFIWIKADTYQDNSGKWRLKNQKDGRGFYVGSIEYNQARKIAYLSIVKGDSVVFSYGDPKAAQSTENERITQSMATRIEALAMSHGRKVEDIMNAYKVQELTELTKRQYANIVRRLENGE